MLTATAIEIQNNFDRFIQAVQEGETVIIIKNGKEVARLIPPDENIPFLTDSLSGVLSNDYDDKAERNERLKPL